MWTRCIFQIKKNVEALRSFWVCAVNVHEEIMRENVLSYLFELLRPSILPHIDWFIAHGNLFHAHFKCCTISMDIYRDD